MKILINIVDVGIGNLISISNWIKSQNIQIRLIRDPESYSSGAIIIPGVSSSHNLINKLKERSFDVLIDGVSKKEKIVGICAGFQSLCISTEEDGVIEGLGHFPLVTKKLNQNGSGRTLWDDCTISLADLRRYNLLNKSSSRKKHIRGRVFFNHEYGVFDQDLLDKNQDWKVENESFYSFYMKKNLIGFQFHPEKSANFGRELIKLIK